MLYVSYYTSYGILNNFQNAKKYDQEIPQSHTADQPIPL